MATTCEQFAENRGFNVNTPKRSICMQGLEMFSGSVFEVPPQYYLPNNDPLTKVDEIQTESDPPTVATEAEICVNPLEVNDVP